jgi:hypothetical protein
MAGGGGINHEAAGGAGTIVDTAELTITYEGAPVDDGQMDAAVLGGALLALADLLAASNRALNGDRSVININVKADFKRGSFGIEGDVVQRMTDAVGTIVPMLPMVGMAHLRTASEIVKTIFKVGNGLVDTVKRFSGKEVVKQTPVTENGTVNVELRDSPNATVNVTVNVPQDTMTLYESPAARLALQRAVAPLQLPGMRDVKAEENGQELVVVEASEVEAFRVPPDLGDERKQVYDDVTTATFEVVALSFYSSRSWKLARPGEGGKDPIAVTIEDKDFLERIDDERFERGLALKVTMRTTVKKKKDGTVEPRYTIEKVHDVIHFNKPTQGRFPPSR